MGRRKVVIDGEYVQKRRAESGMNQCAFWSQFKVTQSGGSRYESGRNIPRPLQMLIWLRYEAGLSNELWETVRKAA